MTSAVIERCCPVLLKPLAAVTSLERAVCIAYKQADLIHLTSSVAAACDEKTLQAEKNLRSADPAKL